MRSCLQAAIGGAFLAVTGGACGATPTLDLLDRCETLVGGWTVTDDTVSFPSDPGSAFCLGYFSAFQAASLGESGGRRIMNICAPGHARITDFVAAFIAYAKAHSDELHRPAGMVVWGALESAFPCPKP